MKIQIAVDFLDAYSIMTKISSNGSGDQVVKNMIDAIDCLTSYVRHNEVMKNKKFIKEKLK